MVRRQIGAMVLWAVVGLLLQGCPFTWQRVTINDTIQPEDVSFILPGTTTLSDIVRELGAPDSLHATQTGFLIRYQFRDAKYFRVNLTRPLPLFIPALSAVPNDLYALTISGGGIGTDELQIGFHQNGTVAHYAFAHHSKASRYIP
ncbi:MAG TPA: hypothetical protein VJ692_00425 [Nitrospiraceae bacterium]|nr:hypothetical protein [Nitrospiraceae bacterium]